MDKFFRNGNTFAYWHENKVIYIYDGYVGFKASKIQIKWPECTREEFTAAALQAIEKLKAQGIDIGTDWLPKWEPKPGEVVCAWDNRNGIGGYIVAKFVTKSNGVFPFELSNGYGYQHIAPFTGEIPEPFKSRWEAERNGPA
jgi:hypothetical protein